MQATQMPARLACTLAKQATRNPQDSRQQRRALGNSQCTPVHLAYMPGPGAACTNTLAASPPDRRWHQHQCPDACNQPHASSPHRGSPGGLCAGTTTTQQHPQQLHVRKAAC